MGLLSLMKSQRLANGNHHLRVEDVGFRLGQEVRRMSTKRRHGLLGDLLSPDREWRSTCVQLDGALMKHGD